MDASPARNMSAWLCLRKCRSCDIGFTLLYRMIAQQFWLLTLIDPESAVFFSVVTLGIDADHVNFIR